MAHYSDSRLGLNPDDHNLSDTIDLVDCLRSKVDARLEQLCPQSRADSRLIEAMRHGLLSPGKRLRPMITLLTCHQCAGDLDRALDPACAIEMVHAASLIIDDVPCMDNAHLRRGRPATHREFGEDIAILAAISLLNEAFRTIAVDDRVDDTTKTRAIRTLTNAVGIDGLASGQERDLSCDDPEPANGIRDVERRHLEKTGALFSAAATLGAAAANADTQQRVAAERFGASLGIAYQTLDDVADVAIGSLQSGKDCNQDRNKTTVLSLLGASGARRSAGRWIDEAIACAEKIDCGAGSTLTDFARLIESKFSAPASSEL